MQLYKNADSLYSGIDFASNRLFVPYFKQYTAWRNNAFKKVKSRYKNQQDSVLISLDIRSYYYSVIFDFENLPRYLNYDSRLTEIAPLTRIIRQIYIDYTSEMKKFRGAIPADCTKDNAPCRLVCIAACYSQTCIFMNLTKRFLSKWALFTMVDMLTIFWLS